MKMRFARVGMFIFLALFLLTTSCIAAVVTTASPPGGSYLAAQDVVLTTSGTPTGSVTTYCTTDETMPLTTLMTPEHICSGTIHIASDAALFYLSTDQSEYVEGLNGSIYVITGGEIRSWGANGNGQRGDGTTTPSLTPVAASGLTRRGHPLGRPKPFSRGKKRRHGMGLGI